MMKWPFGLYGSDMPDYVLREIEVGPRAALCEDMEASGDSALGDIPDRPVPYALTPEGEAAADIDAEPSATAEDWLTMHPSDRHPEGFEPDTWTRGQVAYILTLEGEVVAAGFVVREPEAGI